MALVLRGKSIYADLQKAYANKPTPEVRWRLELLLARLKDAPSEDTAKLRAVQVLETIGGDDADRCWSTWRRGGRTCA